MARQHCIIYERTGDIVYVGDYWDCEEHRRIFLEDDSDNYLIEVFLEDEEEDYMYDHSVVCHYTGEILYESPFLYLCDKFIHDNKIVGAADVYGIRTTVPKIPEYTSAYFDLQMIQIQIQWYFKA